MQSMSNKDKRIEIRLDDETDQELKRLAKAAKISKSQIIRELINQADVKRTDLVVIRQLMETNFATRRELSRVTANINQLAKIYNSGQADDEKIIERDRSNRAEILALLKEEFKYLDEIHDKCLEILGRKSHE